MSEDAIAQANRFNIVLGWILALLVFANVVLRPQLILREPDLFWHIKTGSDILVSRHWPVVDNYSFTYDGQPWIAKEWLAQVLFAGAFVIAGWLGPLVLAALAMGLTALLLYRRFSSFVQPYVGLAG